MKIKKIFFLLILVLCVILVSLFFIFKNFNNENINSFEDYTPEEEITSSALRKTTINLFFIENETGKLKAVSKSIDSKELLQNPYQKLVELLILGTEDENLSSPFPQNVRILDAKLEKSCAILNFSEEISLFSDENQKHNIINCLLNTLSTLNEVESIKILIENSESEKFNEEYFLAFKF